jgi:hypothetical protein
MLDAGWLFGKEEHADAQLVIVEEEEEDADAQAVSTSGERAAKPACGRNGSNDDGGGQADAGSEQAAKTAPKRSREDDTQTATDNNEQPEPAAKRSRAESSEGQVALPIHKLIVMSASEFFKARLGAWQHSNTERCRVVLHVPPGQLEVGRRLVRAMYEAKPSFDDLGLEQSCSLGGWPTATARPTLWKLWQGPSAMLASFPTRGWLGQRCGPFTLLLCRRRQSRCCSSTPPPRCRCCLATWRRCGRRPIIG